MFALVRLFLSVLLIIECIQGYYRRALITNKFYVAERYDDFEIDSDNSNNNKRSPALPVVQAIEALQRYNAECKFYSRIDIIFDIV